MVPCLTNAQKNILDLKKNLDELLNVANSPGAAVLVSKEGKTIFSYYNGLRSLEKQQPIGQHTHFRMASVTKQITAHAIYRLVKEGKLEISTSMTEIFDNLPDEFNSIQIKHLLQHSSGLPDYEYMIPEKRTEQVSDQDVLDIIVQRPKLKFQPGQRFRYSNTAYCILALIIKKVSGLTFADYVKKELFEPINITEALVYTPQARILDRAYGYHPVGAHYNYADQSITSATQGDGGAYLAPLEMQKWCQFLIDRFPKDNDYTKLFNNGMQVKDHVRYQLGLFNFVDKYGHFHLFHSGESTGFQNIIYVDIHNKFSIIVFTNRDDFIVSKLFDEILSFYNRDNLMKTYLGESAFSWLNKIYSGS